MARSAGTNDYLGVVLLISAAAGLSHMAALLRRFGFEVHELCGLPTPAQIADREGCEVQLVIVDEALCIGAEADPVALLLGMLSLASILIVQRAASRRLRASSSSSSDRCRYLAASSSPFDLTLTVVELLKRRARRAH